jgi:anti-sigma B factor antagonist
MAARQSDWLEIEKGRKITVARFTCRVILNEPDIEAVGDRLWQLVAEGSTKIVVNLGSLERASSSLISKLMILQQKVRAAGGRLVLCGLQPEIKEVLKVLNLLPLFTVCDSERQAMASLLGAPQ